MFTSQTRSQIIAKRSDLCRAISMAQKWADKKFPVVRGQRNSNLFTLACVIHDRGVSFDDALFYAVAKFVADDFLGNEIEQVIINAYR